MRSRPSCCLTTTASVLSNILGLYALTGFDTKLSFSDKGKNTCWEIFIKYFHLLTAVVRDDNVDDDWAFVCLLYGIREKGVNSIDDISFSLLYMYCSIVLIYIHVLKNEKKINKKGKKRYKKKERKKKGVVESG